MGLVFGIVAGAVIGVLTGQLAICVGLGVSLGILAQGFQGHRNSDEAGRFDKRDP